MKYRAVTRARIIPLQDQCPAGQHRCFRRELQDRARGPVTSVLVESVGSAHRASDAECGRQARDLRPGGHRDPPGNSRGCLNDPKDCAAVKTVTLPRCPEEDVETKVLSTEAEVRANETRIPQTGRLVHYRTVWVTALEAGRPRSGRQRGRGLAEALREARPRPLTGRAAGGEAHDSGAGAHPALRTRPRDLIEPPPQGPTL